jgi:hypothetical protein
MCRYPDQNEADYEMFLMAIHDGALEADQSR